MLFFVAFEWLFCLGLGLLRRFSAEVDTNFVITSDQKLVGIQIFGVGTLEREKMNELTDLQL